MRTKRTTPVGTGEIPPPRSKAEGGKRNPRRQLSDRSTGSRNSRVGRLGARVCRGGRLTKSEVIGSTACALTFTLWNFAARSEVGPGTFLCFLLFCLTCTFAGRSAARLVGPGAASDFPTVFLFGCLLLNSALYLLAWISPFSILVNALSLLAAVLGWQILRPPPDRRPDAVEGEGEGTGLLTLAICLAAATLWAQDSLPPRVFRLNGVLMRPFVDSYFHTCEIRLFRDAQGAGSLHDIRMAGRPIWFYHHASYLATALVSAATATSAYLSFGSFYVPFGIVLSGLAASALIRALWGGRAGVAAAAALLLVPDASYHLIANHFLSYHWLQQVGPAGLYGVSILAVAWLFMLEGCRAGRVGLVALGLITAGVSVHYKAHLFVAAAPLIWLYPGVFFRGARWGWKAAWLGFGLASLALAVQLAQRVEAVPVLRLDGSSMKTFLDYILGWIDHVPTRNYYARFSPTSSLLNDVAWGSILLFYGALGLFGVAVVTLALVALSRPRRVEFAHAVFPLLVILVWLVMSLGLAYNTKNPMHQDELLHRPFVWAYFVGAAWTGGLAYRLFLDERVRSSRIWRNALAIALVPMLSVPLYLGINVQLGSKRWGRSLVYQTCPRGLFECARYIRKNAGPGDLVQVSEADPKLRFSALCERPAYACAYFDGKPDPVLAGRIEELKTFKAMTNVESIRRFATKHRIRWFVLPPEIPVRWPGSVLANPTFHWRDYRVFRFSDTEHGGEI